MEFNKDLNLVGYKALGLGKMINLDLNVPDYIVVPSNILNDVFGKIKTGIKTNISIIDQIIKLFIDQHPGETFIVRSSANIEDSPSHSFSGVFETIRDVEPNKVINAVERVLLSVKNDSVRKLANQFSITYSEIKMAVIVQVQQEVDIGGVIFSCNPTNGNPTEGVIGYAMDSALNVVEGLKNVKTLKYNRISLKIKDENIKNNPLLIDKIQEIEGSIYQLEKCYNSFIDVEFGLKNNVIYWFQVRPARTLPKFNLYENVNENYELLYLEPFTPLGASIEIEKNKIYINQIRNISKVDIVNAYIYKYGYIFYKKSLIQKNKMSIWSSIKMLINSKILISEYWKFLKVYRIKNNQYLDGCLNQTNYNEIKKRIDFLINNYYLFQKKAIKVGYLSNIYPTIYAKYMQIFKKNKLESLYDLSTPIKEDQYQNLKLLLPKSANPIHFTNDNPKDIGWRLVHSKLFKNNDKISNQKSKIFFDPIRKYLLNKCEIFFPLKDLRNIHFHEGVAAIRKCVKHLGIVMSNKGLLENRDDIFLLDYQDLPSNENDNCFNITNAKKGNSLLKRQSYLFDRKSDVKGGKILQGIACSVGEYSGNVKKARSLSEIENVSNIDILFCPNIKPHWYFLFPNIKALIQEDGYPLAHGANMAREFGIPSVANIPWEAIIDMEYVTVDGNSGKIIWNKI